MDMFQEEWTELSALQDAIVYSYFEVYGEYPSGIYAALRRLTVDAGLLKITQDMQDKELRDAQRNVAEILRAMLTDRRDQGK